MTYLRTRRWQETSSEREERVRRTQHRLTAMVFFAFVAGVVTFVFTRTLLYGAIAFAVFFIVTRLYFAARDVLVRAARVRQMEEVFPDFIDLMASNLRAGMTVDRALLLSSRKEFAPLDQEILRVGKDIVTGKDIARAMKEMGERTGSEKISKTLTIIVSGLRAGGNLSVLLEDTAANMRERRFVEKRSASSVLMYVIFIFFAVAIGAPTLFGLSSVLVTILSTLLSNLPVQDMSSRLPFTLSSVSVSPTFIMYFSIAFILVIDLLASFVLGLVSSDKERDGLKYLLPIVIISLIVFSVSRFGLLSYFKDFFS